MREEEFVQSASEELSIYYSEVTIDDSDDSYPIHSFTSFTVELRFFNNWYRSS